MSPPSSESRRSKAREVSSRFLSPTSSLESANSPPQIKSKSRSGLWPSSNKKQGTLKDFLNNDDNDDDGDGPRLLTRQRSCSEKQKENHRPGIIGGSMRYTGKLRFPGEKSSSTTSKSSSFTNFVKGRLSVDENNLNRRRTIDPFTETISSESECSDSNYNGKNYTYLSSTASSRRLAGIEVSSRYLHDSSLTKSSSRRGESHSASSTPDNSNLPPKNAVRRASSLTAYKSISQWALSPGRSSSPAMSVENKGKPVPSFSNLRPPHSPVKNKGVGNLLSMGLDLFKSKKSSSSNCSSPVGQGVGETSHQLRMFHNRLIQWRFVNARADIVNATKLTQAQSTLSNASASLSDLQSSVVQKRIKLQKEKLEFKLNNVLESQVEPLQNWGDIERQHLSALSTTKDCLHSVVCRVPLVEGATVSHSTSVALRHATDLTASIKTMLTDFSSTAQNEGELLEELAEVVTAERSLLEECFDLIEMLSSLETQEKSLQCNIVQLKSQQRRCQSQNVVV